MSYLRFRSHTRPTVVADGACLEPYVTGSNTLRDPGAETHVSEIGRSEIPQYTFATPGGLIWQSDSTAAPTDTGLVGNFAVARDGSVVTTDPDSGTYHVELTHGGGGVASFYVASLTACSPGVGEYGGLPVGARADAGDTVTLTWRAKGVGTDSNDGTTGFFTWIGTDYVAFDLDVDTRDVVSTVGYGDHSYAAVAPAGTFLALCGIITTYETGKTMRYDNFSVVVTAA